RQVGVPVVRLVGPRIPLHPTRPGGPGVRETATNATDARVVHAPERPTARLRVGVRGRQSARPRLGDMARLQDRAADYWTLGPRLSRTDLPETAPQFHLVGEPQGHRGAQCLSGRIPRIG